MPVDSGEFYRSRYPQARSMLIEKFDTYRSSRQPHVQITGRISDRTHWIKVIFDVNATDQFEACVTLHLAPGSS